MSSTETSGASAEATATQQPTGTPAAASSFGTSRGSGLARGKRSTNSPATETAATPAEYTPTAIEIINAPREYKNPFAPAASEAAVSTEQPAVAVINEPAPVAPAPVAPTPAPAPAPVRAHVSTAPAAEMFPLDDAPASAAADEKAELNILPPERQKSVAPQTWESDGFRPAPAREREPRNDRPRSNDRPLSDDRPRSDDRRGGERREGEPRRDEQPIPSKFRYERAKDGPLPPRPAPVASAVAAPAPHKSGGFLGWLKSLFGGAPAAKPAAPQNGDARPEGRDGDQRHRRHRGGRDRGNFRGQGGGQPQAGGEGRGQGGGEYGERRDGGHRRRRRGGRGRSGFGGERQGHGGGGGQGGPSAT